MAETTFIGRPTRLIDGQVKVTGAAQYAPDLRLPGMLYARLVTSPHAHARVRAVHAEGARATPGVAAVLTARDMPAVAPSSRGRLLLARERVIFVGQPVAMVLADSEAAQKTALNCGGGLRAAPGSDYWMRPYENAAGLAAGVPSGAADLSAHGRMWRHVAGALSNIAEQSTRTRGDVRAGFAEADVVVERTFTTPMVHQNSIEPQAVIAQPDPATGGVVLWASTQGPFDARKSVAEVLGIPESDVRVIGMTVGGGFGGKNGLYEPLAAAAAMAVGRPVRLVLSRMEDW
jgi:CO/xanthine dehydrogenase Mo-binding subunit